MMETKLWEIQKSINENNNTQIMALLKQIELLVSILEDHENDMKKMAEKINELERQLSERA